MAKREGSNGAIRTIFIGAATTLMAGGIFGLLALWSKAVGAEDVSRQIQTESPYVKDRELIRRALDQDLPAMKDKLDLVREEQITHRAILERIERKMEQPR